MVVAQAAADLDGYGDHQAGTSPGDQQTIRPLGCRASGDGWRRSPMDAGIAMGVGVQAFDDLDRVQVVGVERERQVQRKA